MTVSKEQGYLLDAVKGWFNHPETFRFNILES